MANKDINYENVFACLTKTSSSKSQAFNTHLGNTKSLVSSLITKLKSRLTDFFKKDWLMICQGGCTKEEIDRVTQNHQTVLTMEQNECAIGMDNATTEWGQNATTMGLDACEQVCKDCGLDINNVDQVNGFYTYILSKEFSDYYIQLSNIKLSDVDTPPQPRELTPKYDDLFNALTSQCTYFRNALNTAERKISHTLNNFMIHIRSQFQKDWNKRCHNQCTAEEISQISTAHDSTLFQQISSIQIKFDSIIHSWGANAHSMGLTKCSKICNSHGVNINNPDHMRGFFNYVNNSTDSFSKYVEELAGLLLSDVDHTPTAKSIGPKPGPKPDGALKKAKEAVQQAWQQWNSKGESADLANTLYEAISKLKKLENDSVKLDETSLHAVFQPKDNLFLNPSRDPRKYGAYLPADGLVNPNGPFSHLWQSYADGYNLTLVYDLTDCTKHLSKPANSLQVSFETLQNRCMGENAQNQFFGANIHEETFTVFDPHSKKPEDNYPKIWTQVTPDQAYGLTGKAGWKNGQHFPSRVYAANPTVYKITKDNINNLNNYLKPLLGGAPLAIGQYVVVAWSYNGLNLPPNSNLVYFLSNATDGCKYSPAGSLDFQIPPEAKGQTFTNQHLITDDRRASIIFTADEDVVRSRNVSGTEKSGFYGSGVFSHADDSDDFIGKLKYTTTNNGNFTVYQNNNNPFLSIDYDNCSPQIFFDKNYSIDSLKTYKLKPGGTPEHLAEINGLTDTRAINNFNNSIQGWVGPSAGQYQANLATLINAWIPSQANDGVHGTLVKNLKLVDENGSTASEPYHTNATNFANAMINACEHCNHFQDAIPDDTQQLFNDITQKKDLTEYIINIMKEANFFKIVASESEIRASSDKPAFLTLITDIQQLVGSKDHTKDTNAILSWLTTKATSSQDMTMVMKTLGLMDNSNNTTAEAKQLASDMANSISGSTTAPTQFSHLMMTCDIAGLKLFIEEIGELLTSFENPPPPGRAIKPEDFPGKITDIVESGPNGWIASKSRVSKDINNAHITLMLIDGNQKILTTNAKQFAYAILNKVIDDKKYSAKKYPIKNQPINKVYEAMVNSTPQALSIVRSNTYGIMTAHPVKITKQSYSRVLSLDPNETQLTGTGGKDNSRMPLDKVKDGIKTRWPSSDAQTHPVMIAQNYILPTSFQTLENCITFEQIDLSGGMSTTKPYTGFINFALLDRTISVNGQEIKTDEFSQSSIDMLHKTFNSITVGQQSCYIEDPGAGPNIDPSKATNLLELRLTKNLDISTRQPTLGGIHALNIAESLKNDHLSKTTTPSKYLTTLLGTLEFVKGPLVTNRYKNSTLESKPFDAKITDDGTVEGYLKADISHYKIPTNPKTKTNAKGIPVDDGYGNMMLIYRVGLLYHFYKKLSNGHQDTVKDVRSKLNDATTLIKNSYSLDPLRNGPIDALGLTPGSNYSQMMYTDFPYWNGYSLMGLYFLATIDADINSSKWIDSKDTRTMLISISNTIMDYYDSMGWAHMEALLARADSGSLESSGEAIAGCYGVMLMGELLDIDLYKTWGSTNYQKMIQISKTYFQLNSDESKLLLNQLFEKNYPSSRLSNNFKTEWPKLRAVGSNWGMCKSDSNQFFMITPQGKPAIVALCTRITHTGIQIINPFLAVDSADPTWAKNLTSEISEILNSSCTDYFTKNCPKMTPEYAGGNASDNCFVRQGVEDWLALIYPIVSRYHKDLYKSDPTKDPDTKALSILNNFPIDQFHNNTSKGIVNFIDQYWKQQHKS